MLRHEFNDEQLLRYSRHILLDDIGIEGQARIASAKVLIVGAGGLGCPSSLYLACAGVGTIYLADDDVVDLTNLQRQVLHTTERVGMAKVESAKAQLNALNPQSAIHTLAVRLEGSALDELLAQVDVVLDCSDNFKTRHAVNASCVKFKKPLVSGAAIGLEGQLACFELNNPDAPCYNCLFPQNEEESDNVRCATMGVFAPLTGVIGTLQASEALKILAGFGSPLFSALQCYDARQCEFKKTRIRKDPQCPVCSAIKNGFD